MASATKMKNSFASPALTAPLLLRHQDTSLRCTVSNTESKWIERVGKGKLVGDCDLASCEKVAGSITPVPGGGGPMTTACLLGKTVRAARAHKGIAIPEL
jgi:hypothetical protein